ncbi:g2554 [Coccomyxa viridis]|uniref:G2554 protein n=1 Tax=Coccomyxa viridis TaxID=1274662 RepID=A0ABP1FR42_9CHLO
MATLEAFRSFDFDGDERWRQYEANIEIPPGRDRDSVLKKFKAKWYKREIDPDFDIAQAVPASSASTAPQRAHTSRDVPKESTDASAASPPEHQSTPAAASPPPTPTPSASRKARPGKTASTERNLFVLHVLQLLLGLGAVQPLFWLVSARSWKAFLAVSALCHLYKVIIKHGVPQLRPFPGALKQWVLPASSSTDFQYLMLCMLFLQSRPLALVVVPIWTLALYHAVAYAGSRFGSTRLWQQYGAKLQHILSAYQGQALIFNAAAEIGAGILLLLGLLTPQRSIMLAFVYWRAFLPTRYNTPDAAGYHRQVWQIIADKTRPVLQAVPMLRIPIDFVKRSFDQPR